MYSFLKSAPVIPLLNLDKEEFILSRDLISKMLTLLEKNSDSVAISERLLLQFHSLSGILSASYQDLIGVEGISNSVAEIFCEFRKLHYESARSKVISLKYDDHIDLFKSFIISVLQSVTVENMLVLYFNHNRRCLAIECATSDECNKVLISSKTIIKKCILTNTSSVIFAHNHLSGERSPSVDDIRFTKEMQKILTVIGVNIIDHYIVFNGEIASMKQGGWF